MKAQRIFNRLLFVLMNEILTIMHEKDDDTKADDIEVVEKPAENSDNIASWNLERENTLERLKALGVSNGTLDIARKSIEHGRRMEYLINKGDFRIDEVTIEELDDTRILNMVLYWDYKCREAQNRESEDYCRWPLLILLLGVLTIPVLVAFGTL